MGYTHYFARKEKVIDDYVWKHIATNTARVLFEVEEIGLAEICGPMGEGSWEVNKDYIAFNGKAPDLDCESMYFPKVWDGRSLDGKMFSFCKTRQKPYDVAVVAVLFVLKNHLWDEIEISSDGNMEDFHDGFHLYCRVTRKSPYDFGYKFEDGQFKLIA